MSRPIERKALKHQGRTAYGVQKTAMAKLLQASDLLADEFAFWTLRDATLGCTACACFNTTGTQNSSYSP
jgi:hypothetical protein